MMVQLRQAVFLLTTISFTNYVFGQKTVVGRGQDCDTPFLSVFQKDQKVCGPRLTCSGVGNSGKCSCDTTVYAYEDGFLGSSWSLFGAGCRRRAGSICEPETGCVSSADCESGLCKCTSGTVRDVITGRCNGAARITSVLGLLLPFGLVFLSQFKNRLF